MLDAPRLGDGRVDLSSSLFFRSWRNLGFRANFLGAARDYAVPRDVQAFVCLVLLAEALEKLSRKMLSHQELLFAAGVFGGRGIVGTSKRCLLASFCCWQFYILQYHPEGGCHGSARQLC